ncbi:MAG: AraC family transcriptional regulator [Clostridia bacterium]|nr:AraC family transcriptional regulator [Clostridia bacterium]
MDKYIVKDLLHFCNVTVKRSTKIEWRTIDYFDLTFVIKGQLHYTINDRIVVLRENDAILLPPGTLRSRPSVDGDVHYVSFNFTAYDEGVLPTKLYYENAITREIRSLASVFSEQHLSAFYHSHEKMTNILNCILFEFIDTVSLGSNDKNVLSVLKYIDENLTERITIGEIGRAVHLSNDYISHCFKRELGRSVMDYVNERRMLLARNMISGGEMSLTDIAEALGYDSYSYFSRVFKRYFGVSPIRYK